MARPLPRCQMCPDEMLGLANEAFFVAKHFQIPKLASRERLAIAVKCVKHPFIVVTLHHEQTEKVAVCD